MTAAASHGFHPRHGERERAGDDGLRRDDGRRRGEDHKGVESPRGGQPVERVVRGRRVVDEEGPLSEIVEEQGRTDETEPVHLNRPFAEVAHVCVERFTARRDEEHGPEHEKAPESVAEEKMVRMSGIDGGQHGRVAEDSGDAERREGAEPEKHDGTENGADLRRPAPLKEKQTEEDDDRDGNDKLREVRGRDVQAFDRGEDRDRRSDDAVAVEQRGSEESEWHDETSQTRLLAALRLDETHQRENPALPPVVEPQDVHVVLESDDDDQRPEDERENAHHVGSRRLDAVRAEKALA